MNNYAVRRRAIAKATASIPIPRFTPHACEANGGQECHYWRGAVVCSRRGWGRSPNRPVIKLENKASHDESRAGYDIAAVERA